MSDVNEFVNEVKNKDILKSKELLKKILKEKVIERIRKTKTED